MKARKSKTNVTESLSKRLGKLVETEMKNKKVNKTQIAKNIGIDRTALIKYINDDIEIGVNALVKIAEYYHVSTDYLLGLSLARTNDIKDISEQEVYKAVGVAEAGQSTIKKIVEDGRGPDSSKLRYREIYFNDSYFKFFSGKRILNYFLMETSNLRNMFQHLKTYTMLYVTSRSIPQLPENSEYKVFDNAEGPLLQQSNSYYFFMADFYFRQAIENVAIRMMNHLKLDTDEGAKAYMISRISESERMVGEMSEEELAEWYKFIDTNDADDTDDTGGTT